MIRFILTDIEGTTTSIDFVHQVLFPYATQHLTAFVQAQAANPLVQQALQEVKSTLLSEENRQLTTPQAIEQLHEWIQQDRKHPALKLLQGYLWKEGYESGQYQGHIYPDVPPALHRWQQQQIGLGVYSSGSVAAQQLLFRYSDYGDLTPFFSAYFDTEVGHKKTVLAYQNIQQKLGIPATHILFLSDVAEELDAAAAAGFQHTSTAAGHRAY